MITDNQPIFRGNQKMLFRNKRVGSNYMKRLRNVILIVFLIVLTWFIWLALRTQPPDWTGFGKRTILDNEIPAKTLFDWMELLLIPVSIAIIGWIYKESEKAQAKENESERSKNETLDSFFEIMTELIKDHDLAGVPNNQTIAIAKTRISMSLSQLDGSRKGQVLQFLYQSELIYPPNKINLNGTKFNNAVLDEIVLYGAEIRGVYFNNATIKNANLSHVDFNSCDFSNADLSESNVLNADFSYTNLSKCRLKNMDLTSVNFEGANLTNANLQGSKISRSQLDSIFDKKNLCLTKAKII